MNKKEYKELLQREEWQSKRKIILERDNYKCAKCNCKNNLHVHHKYYLEGKMPWDVPNDCLVTLCDICHKNEHKGKDIKSFVRKNPLKKIFKKLNKNNIRYNNMIKNLSKEDVLLQEKYDKVKNKFK